MKRTLILILTLALLCVGLVACSPKDPEDPTPAPSSAYKDGTFTGVGTSESQVQGSTVSGTVRVTIENGKLKRIDVIADPVHGSSYAKWETEQSNFINLLLQKTPADIEAIEVTSAKQVTPHVSGATVSSEAFIKAVQNAISKAKTN